MPAPSSSRRPRSRLPRHRAGTPDLLADVVRLVDASFADAVPEEHLAFHATVEDGEVALGVRPIPIGVHPFSELAGLVAPPSWEVFGLRVHGTGHRLDDGTRRPTTSTFAVDRAGAERSVLHDGDRRVEPGDGAVGTLPDLCRRVLGLPTPPPPARTHLLFAVAWLDRLLEAWSDPLRRRRIMSSFAAAAALHPAVADGEEPPDDPFVLSRLAAAHAEAWPWARLRREPDALAPPGGGLPGSVAAWMDDGAFARWVLGAYPDLGALVVDTLSLLGPVVADDVRTVVIRTLEGER
jgi:hypothetical protein